MYNHETLVPWVRKIQHFASVNGCKLERIVLTHPQARNLMLDALKGVDEGDYKVSGYRLRIDGVWIDFKPNPRSPGLDHLFVVLTDDVS